MERILDLSNGFDVQLLEKILSALNVGSPQERQQANQVLVTLKENPNAWRVVVNILQTSNDSTAKFFGLQILEDTIKFRWMALPQDERNGVKNYTVSKIIELSKDEMILKREKVFVQKLNLVLVQILKQEWPQNWPNFIPEIVSSSQTSETLCENNMQILKLLSEEIFDFSKEEMTTEKVSKLKEQLNHEFKQIFELCQLVLQQSQKESLLLVTLQTLLKFLSWIPLGFIFETNLIELLLTKFLPVRGFRNATMACCTEIGTLKEQKYDEIFVKMFDHVIRNLTQTLPMSVDIAVAFESAAEYDCLYIQGLSLFFSSFFSSHLDILEKRAISGGDGDECLLKGMEYLVKISKVYDKEIFKICLDFWNVFTSDLYKSERQTAGFGGMGHSNQSLGFYGTNVMNVSSGFLHNGLANNNRGGGTKVQAYARVLSQLREVMISKMAKPEEVLVVESEDGAIIRETTKDTDAIAQYKTMRDTLVFLTHLDFDDTEDIMLKILSQQCDTQKIQNFQWQKLNTLCWAIGSISGVPNEEEEKSFLVVVIKDLLTLCEVVRGKDNKAVVASNIMYVVGQYPSFLKNHWKFLKTVMNKLFEFMHELHPGVQDMACDTFLKISKKCRDHIVANQQGENEPFILELLRSLPAIVSDLQPHQVQTMYESIAQIIVIVPNEERQDELLRQLMAPPNATWQEILNSANGNVNTLYDLNVIRELCKILRTNTRVCSAMGLCFIQQLRAIYFDILNVYRSYSSQISQAVRSEGEQVTKHVHIKAMRTFKIEALRLFETFLGSLGEFPTAGKPLVEGLYAPVLDDYKDSVPDNRNPEVLKLFAVVVDRLKDVVQPVVLQIFDAVFMPTLEMITSNFTDYPEHRLYFFQLLKAVNAHCFQTLFSVPPEAQKQIINSICWAFKHTERNISETGLEILEKLLDNVDMNPNFAQEFYKRFYLLILQNVLYVLTDRLHKSSFALHCQILKKLFLLVEVNKIQISLVESETDLKLEIEASRSTPNGLFLRRHVSKMLINEFPDVSPQVVESFVDGMFRMCKEDDEKFRDHMRDFLIKLKEYSKDGDDNSKLYEQEKDRMRKEQLIQRAAIPGLLTQKEQEEMDDL